MRIHVSSYINNNIFYGYQQVGIAELSEKYCVTLFAESVSWALSSSVTQLNRQRKIVVECPSNFHIEKTPLEICYTGNIYLQMNNRE
jgi:hypothetical protein